MDNKNTNKNIINYDQMDENNKKALQILKTKGQDEVAKFMLKHPKEKKFRR